MQSFISDLKYLGRLNYYEFEELLFPESESYYVMPKWEVFRDNLFGFLCACSDDKIEILIQFIKEAKGEI
jgi:hypothetical protein